MKLRIPVAPWLGSRTGKAPFDKPSSGDEFVAFIVPMVVTRDKQLLADLQWRNVRRHEIRKVVDKGYISFLGEPAPKAYLQ